MWNVDVKIKMRIIGTSTLVLTAGLYLVCLVTINEQQMHPQILPYNISQDRHQSEKYQYQYAKCKDGICEKVKGKTFKVTENQLKRIGFPIPTEKYIDLFHHTQQFVLATASSDNHYAESRSNIVTAQMQFPNHTTILYNLGLSNKKKNKLQKICMLEIRQFNFSNYPQHVRNLKNYAWKLLIIYDLLREYTGVLWMDTSVRFLKPFPNLMPLHKLASPYNGVVLFSNAGHSNLAVTHPGMYKYIPTNFTAQRTTMTYQAGFALWYRTRHTIENILKWSVLCALDPNCISPKGSELKCNFTQGRLLYANCHRFDQALINIILSNFFNFNSSLYTTPIRFYRITRSPEKNIHYTKYC